jgi:hypothetical protein
MVPVATVDKELAARLPLLEAGDIVIDGGNSYYHDDIRRGADWICAGHRQTRREKRSSQYTAKAIRSAAPCDRVCRLPWARGVAPLAGRLCSRASVMILSLRTRQLLISRI